MVPRTFWGMDGSQLIRVTIANGATWSGRGTERACIKGRDREAFRVAG